MLTQSTTQQSAKALESQLERIGATIRSWATDDEINIQVQSETSHLTEALQVLKMYVLNPKFDTNEFELERKQMLDAYQQSLTSASAIADMGFRAKLYGKHVMGLPTGGTSESLKSITQNDIIAFFKHLGTLNLSISACGSADWSKIAADLDFLKTLQTGKKITYTQDVHSKLNGTVIYFIDKPQAAQSEIRIGGMRMPFDATGTFFKSQVANFAFAGAFNSRINYELREIKGWTYGTRGSFMGNTYNGPYQISGGFKANATDSTLRVFFDQFKQLQTKGLTLSEFDFAKSSITQSEALKYESQAQKLGFIKRLLDYNLKTQYTQEQAQLLKRLTLSELNILA
ncbi:MAG: M16 family metallopeptidase, partial [Bacteroidia bacterium]